MHWYEKAEDESAFQREMRELNDELRDRVHQAADEAYNAVMRTWSSAEDWNDK